jgi:serine/threonine protein kinase
VIRLLLEIGAVVKFVHEKNIIHCDINPSNLIRRTSDSKLVLIDFGSAKQVGNLASNYSNQVQPSIPGYAPTEQKNGHPEFNSDIYAVGMIGMQALTGLGTGLLRNDGYNWCDQWSSAYAMP